MAMSGPFLGHFRLYLIDFTKVISLKVGEICFNGYCGIALVYFQPGGQLETPGLVAFCILSSGLYSTLCIGYCVQCNVGRVFLYDYPN